MTLNAESFWKPEAGDRHLTVAAGSLWVTRSGDAVDRVLVAGDTLELKGKGWLVQALGGTPCVFTTSTSSPANRTPVIPSRSSSKKAG